MATRIIIRKHDNSNTDRSERDSFDSKGEPTTVRAQWRKWRRAFDFFVDGKGVKDPKQMKALLLHCGGMDLQDVYFTLPAAPEPGEGKTETTQAAFHTSSECFVARKHELWKWNSMSYGSEYKTG